MGTLKRLLNKIIKKTDETEEKANVIKKKETKKVVLRKKTASDFMYAGIHSGCNPEFHPRRKKLKGYQKHNN
jgi:hypothetical protein